MEKVFFLDIDDCLIETSALKNAEITAVLTSLETLHIPHSHLITTEFVTSFGCMYDHHQGKTLSEKDENQRQAFLMEIERWEKPIIQKYGQIKKWSREVMLFICAYKYDIHLTTRQLKTISSRLWSAIEDDTPLYRDAKKMLSYFISHHIPLYLISASDCRLQFDDKKQEFLYDPAYSKRLKMNRLRIFLDMGISSTHIFIGDPYDKPDVRLFKDALSFVQTHAKMPIHTIMVGDSIHNDLAPAKKAGMQDIVLIKRHDIDPSSLLPDKIVIISDLYSLISHYEL